MKQILALFRAWRTRSLRRTLASPVREREMLVLSRRLNEAIVINSNIRISVVEIRGDSVRLGIESPREIPVYREENLPLQSAAVPQPLVSPVQVTPGGVIPSIAIAEEAVVFG